MVRVVSLDDRNWKDHGAVEGEKKTLCGRPLAGMKWFYRGSDKFTGTLGFHCSQCCKALKKLGSK